MSIGAPQKHRDWPPGNCAGNLQPVSHMAYFPTPSGGRWHAVTVKRVLSRLA
jgi:hypothetical protein